jgi:ADP-L-glycero-D-manno-heptose 6-epimerase
MEKDLIVVTGAAGFIGSCMVEYLNAKGFGNILLVDNFTNPSKEKNWKEKKFVAAIERDIFFEWLTEKDPTVSCVIHLGARTDTTEFDYSIHEKLNVAYSKDIWEYCTKKSIPLIYASSAATYGNGEFGYEDNHEIVERLIPMNPYGVSKNEFDKWALAQQTAPPYWAGLKFFNVYGPNEYHKGRMASVIFHSVRQINEGGEVRLFRSHKEGIENGQQLRDFIYVKDVVGVIEWMAETMLNEKWDVNYNGLINLGTGIARSFYDLVLSTFKGLELEPNIKFIDMPLDIRDKYQYFTEANMKKLRDAGYQKPFYTLEDGVIDYVKNYLSTEAIY